MIRDTEEEARRAARAYVETNRGWERGPEIAGTAETVVERVAPYLELGFHHIYFDMPAPFDHETLERLIGEVRPRLEERMRVAAAAV